MKTAIVIIQILFFITATTAYAGIQNSGWQQTPALANLNNDTVAISSERTEQRSADPVVSLTPLQISVSMLSTIDTASTVGLVTLFSKTDEPDTSYHWVPC